MIRAVLLGLAVAIHPLHTTHTEVVLAAHGEAKVTIRAFTDDLRAAVLRHEGTVTDSTLMRYLRATVGLRGPDGHAAELSWNASQVDGDITQLALTARLSAPLAGSTLSQTMQMELFPDQVNVVQVRYDGRQVSLLFFGGDKARALP